MKKVVVFIDSEEIIGLLKAQEERLDVHVVKDRTALKESHGALLFIDDKVMSTQEVIDFRKAKEDVPILYLANRRTLQFSARKELVRHKIDLITNHMASPLIVAEILEKLYGEVAGLDTKNVYAFFGADHGVGTTGTVASIADYIVAESDAKVALIHMTGRLEDDYHSIDFNSSLDDVKNSLANNLISSSEINDVMAPKGDNLSIMPGIYRYYYKDEYNPEMMDYFLQMIEKEYDIVLVDGGSGAKSQFLYGALYHTKHRYLVIDQSARIVRRFMRDYIEILDNLRLNDFAIIVNKYIDDSNLLISPEEIADKLDHVVSAVIPMSDNGLQAEYNRESLYNFNDRHYKKAIEVLGAAILEEQGFKTVVKKVWYQKFLRAGV